MALLDLGYPREAIGRFEESVATSPHQVRTRYVHLGYLLRAQPVVGTWNDAETTMRQIALLAGEVASARTVVLLSRILPELKHEHVPRSTRETTEQLTWLLSRAVA
jgi:hypothetical protein